MAVTSGLGRSLTVPIGREDDSRPEKVVEEEEADSVPGDQEAFKNSRATSGSQCFVRLLFGQLLFVSV